MNLDQYYYHMQLFTTVDTIIYTIPHIIDDIYTSFLVFDILRLFNSSNTGNNSNNPVYTNAQFGAARQKISNTKMFM